MSKPITVPVALNQTRSGTATSPWFVHKTEYQPTQSTFMPLVNGEEAFGEVYRAIEAAQHSVDIVCWGFQPSMRFVRDGKALRIGSLVTKKGLEGVKVRILCWSDSLMIAKFGENMAPGSNIWWGDNENMAQNLYDRWWHNTLDLRFNVDFVTRDFSMWERWEIDYQLMVHAKDKAIGPKTIAALTAEPSHHQKMVLIDYEHADQAVGFVMGHNMLDAYWDKDDHSTQRKEPDQGRNGATPRQDMSSKVTGPVLEHLNHNFCTAWEKETGQDLLSDRQAAAAKLQPRRALGSPAMVQLLRTQSQAGKRDIEKLYLQAVNNASQFIYIENQYFRWLPLVDAIKDGIKKQLAAGRDPGQHGPLHLFVVTNSNDEGIGKGIHNTYRMLDALGRADTLPTVTRQERLSEAEDELAYKRTRASGMLASQQDFDDYQAAQKKVKAMRAEGDKATVLPQEIPGLKVHICTLVAPDSPGGVTHPVDDYAAYRNPQPKPATLYRDGVGRTSIPPVPRPGVTTLPPPPKSVPVEWQYVYIHAKLMIVDDVFMTLGSANINTRSMEVDSELNICHERPEITQPLRRRLWGLHTAGQGAQDDPAAAFKGWNGVIVANKLRQAANQTPIASLIGFLRNSPNNSDMD